MSSGAATADRLKSRCRRRVSSPFFELSDLLVHTTTGSPSSFLTLKSWPTVAPLSKTARGDCEKGEGDIVSRLPAGVKLSTPALEYERRGRTSMVIEHSSSTQNERSSPNGSENGSRRSTEAGEGDELDRTPMDRFRWTGAGGQPTMATYYASRRY